MHSFLGNSSSLCRKEGSITSAGLADAGVTLSIVTSLRVFGGFVDRLLGSCLEHSHIVLSTIDEP